MPDRLAEGGLTTALTINRADVETIGSKRVCSLDNALRLVEEFNQLFPGGLPFTILGNEWIEASDESGLFENAFDLKIEEAKKLLGLPAEVNLAEQSDEMKRKFQSLVIPETGSYRTPNIVSLFQDGKVKSREEVLALVDDGKAPLDRMYIEACFRDSRINVASLLERMSHRMDTRDIFPEAHPETGEVRDGFRQLIAEVFEQFDLGEVGPPFLIVRVV